MLAQLIEQDKPFEIGGYTVDILTTGYPGRSLVHGGLGWSSVILLRGHGRVLMMDTGGYGYRRELRKALTERSVAPKDVTDLVLSHSHYDHSVNWPLFKDARIWLGKEELAWSLEQPWGETPVPEIDMQVLKDWPTLELMVDGQTIAPNIVARLAPGHTMGHMIFIIEGEGGDLVLLQDAVKSRPELVARKLSDAVDAAAGTRTCQMVWDLWARKPGTVLIPGHDLPLILDNGAPKALGARRAAIAASFADDPLAKTVFHLTEEQAPT